MHFLVTYPQSMESLSGCLERSRTSSLLQHYTTPNGVIIDNMYLQHIKKKYEQKIIYFSVISNFCL